MKVWLLMFKGVVNDDEHVFPKTIVISVYDSKEKAEESAKWHRNQENAIEMDDMMYDDYEYYVKEYDVE